MKVNKVRKLGQETKTILKVSFFSLFAYSIVTKAEMTKGADGSFKARYYTTSTKKTLDFTIEFIPPMRVRLEVIFPNSTWRFHQEHYIVPLRPDKCRLFFRNMRNWLKWLPEWVMVRGNAKVLNQDFAILVSQRMRLLEGSSRWNLPVSADALGVAYKKWVEENQQKELIWFKKWNNTMKKPSIERKVVLDIEDLGSFQQMCGPCSPSELLECENVHTIKKVKQRIPDIWPLSSKKKSSSKLTWVIGALAIITALAIPYLRSRSFF
jgi:hypothetical protein